MFDKREKIIRAKIRLETTYNVKLDEKTRKAEVVARRSAFAVAAAHQLMATREKIGEVIGKDHSTVTHYVRNHANNYQMPHYFCEEYTKWYDISCEVMRDHNINFQDRVASSMLIGFLPESPKQEKCKHQPLTLKRWLESSPLI